jgi:DNA repair exonuclease SbcCD ATPase subunit
MIEQLLGITQLSEKAESLKEQMRGTKSAEQQEEFRIKAVQDANVRIKEQIDSLRRRQSMWQKKKDDDLVKLQQAYDELDKIDIEAELTAHKALTDYNEKTNRLRDARKWLASVTTAMAREEKVQDKLKREIEDLRNHKCYACGSDIHDENQATVLEEKEKQLKESAMQWLSHQGQQMEHQDTINELSELGAPPRVFYDKEADAFEHRASMGNILSQLVSRQDEQDPYSEQIADMETRAMEDIDYTEMNRLVQLKEHQDFLLKLLTSKDSFVRKRIIDQNLAYLNQRLSYYLDKIGLPHTVTFLNDLTVDISELGRELDFDNLSRGERNRLILSLSWAFRDVWESLYQPINLLFIDEMIDSGMDSSGVEASLAILKRMSRDRNKSVWLVSHRDELIGRVNNVLTVTKENGFTTYGVDTDLA